MELQTTVHLEKDPGSAGSATWKNSLADFLPQSIFILDSTGKYLYFNQQYQNWLWENFQFSPQLGAFFWDGPDFGLKKGWIKEGFRLAFSGRIAAERCQIKSRISPPRWYELTLQRLYHSANMEAVFGTFSEIQSMVDREEELKGAKEAAMSDAQAKSAFLSNMSHEIRTPMNAIMGLTELLLQKRLEESALENLRAIHFSANNLLTIINDILDLSKIEAGKLALDFQTFDLLKVLEELNKSIRVSAQVKNLVYEVQLSGSIPPFLKGDPVRLTQILMNLLGNSVKFTQSGKIRLAVDVYEENSNQVRIGFSIQDTGIGIPKDQLQTIFQSFTQVQSDRKFKTQGTGLGLAITRRLVEMQSGTISVESELGKGSKFRFEIPFEKSTQQEVFESRKEEVKLDGSFSEMRVLLVEDNKINQLLAKQVLEGWDMVVEVANDGFEAIAKLQRRPFDLILLDLQMPEMDGFEVTRFVRKGLKSPFNAIPIVALTADAYSETRIKTQEAGMNDFLTKPYQQKDLYRVISRFFSNKNPGLEINSKPESVLIQAIDFDFVKEKFGKDADTLRFILEVFRDEIGEEILKAKKHLQANESLHASKIIHKLVSTFGAMGMRETALQLSAMEVMLKQNQSPVEVLQKLLGVEQQYQAAVIEIQPVLANLS